MAPTQLPNEGTQGADDWIEERGGLHDTMARFDLGQMYERATTRTVTLIGTSSPCRDRFTLNPGRNTVGRQPGVNILLDNRQVSRLHATIDVTNEAVRLEDPGSSNGTFVNGLKVRQAVLRDGDVVYFGKQLRFVVSVKEPARAVAGTAPARPAEKPAGKPRKAPVPAAEKVVPVRHEAVPTTPAGFAAQESTKIEQLERERRQLAMLYQLALRYLTRGDTDPADILFGALERLVPFEAAFVTRDGVTFLVHPSGIPLAPEECQRLWGERDPQTVKACDGPKDEIALEAICARSRVLIPIAGCGCIGLLTGEAHAYSDQLDYLTLLGQLHSTAVSGSGVPKP